MIFVSQQDIWHENDNIDKFKLCRGKIFLHSNKSFLHKSTSYSTNSIVNDTARMVPLGAKYYDYSMASNKIKTAYI